MQPHDWLTWQLIDSAYPTGGFVHSGGVEAALRHGWLEGPVGLAVAMPTLLRSAAMVTLPFAAAAHDRPDDFDAIDQRCDATILSTVARRASTEQGRAMLSATARVFDDPRFADLDQRCRDRRAIGHHAVVFGTVTCWLGLPREQAGRVLLYQTARALVSAAIRLNIVGPIEGQRLIADTGPLVDDLADHAMCVPLDEVCQTAPLLELAQSCHDRAYTRLFRS